MNKLAIQQRRAGFAAFFISGICAISSGVVVSLLQEEMGFAYGTMLAGVLYTSGRMDRFRAAKLRLLGRLRRGLRNQS